MATNKNSSDAEMQQEGAGSGNKKRKGGQTLEDHSMAGSSSILSVGPLPPTYFGGGRGTTSSYSASMALTSSPASYDEGRCVSSAEGCFAGMKRGAATSTATAATAATATKPKATDSSKSSSSSSNTQETEDAMEYIAKEMKHLTLKEREQAYEDLHGVSEIVQETSELITKSIQKMEQHLQMIQHKPAYDMAKSISNDYVHHIQLRLMFLRADRFDTESAAKRLVKWFEWKLKLFGVERLCQWYIGFDELDDDARFMIESGFLQILPNRDSRGRPILVTARNYHRRLYRTTTSLQQLVFYMIMCLIEDDINQINGVVMVDYNLGKDRDDWDATDSNLRDATWDTCSMITCLPLRTAALHFLTVPNTLQYLLVHVAKSIGKTIRARLRVHFGSHDECAYTLETFGISSSLLPFTTDGGELKTTNHQKWIQRRKVKDQNLYGHALRFVPTTTRIFAGIDLPNRNDVLFGKGKPIQCHPGNQRLQELTRIYLEEYDEAGRNHGGRTAVVALKIVNDIKNLTAASTGVTTTVAAAAVPDHGVLGGVGSGGTGNEGCRFLQISNESNLQGWWEEVTDEDIILEKVCNGIRNARRKKTAK